MALLFDAATERVDHPTILLSSVCSVGGWIKPNNIDANFRHLAGQAAASASMYRFMSSNSGGAAGEARVTIPYSTTLLDYFTDDSPIVVDAWNFLFFTVDASLSDGNRANIYVGSLTAAATEASLAAGITEPAGTIRAPTGDLRFGLDTNGSFAFEGDIAVVWAWPNTMLTLKQVVMHQWNTVPKIAGCEVFSHYQGGQATDWSGNGYNGVITGATQASHVPLPRILNRPKPRYEDAAVVAGGRIMSSLVGAGGLAGTGGIAGQGGGLAA